ncbi:MAG: hypothetical protein RDU20_00370 [Desulfomonilaceae bacterium]|nr:hypothetical protein [Desulfomonilaceae bacterium]
MAKLDKNEDLDALIDKAVDTFFVEEPGPGERAAWYDSEEAETPESQAASSAGGEEPSLDDAVDTLFMRSYEEGPSFQEDFAPPPAAQRPVRKKVSQDEDFPAPSPGGHRREALQEPLPDFASSTVITSGDPDTDRAIDLAVDTLFVEEPETPAPETTQLEVTPTEPFEPPDMTPPAFSADRIAERMLQGTPRKKEQAAAGRLGTADPQVPDYNDAMAQEIQRQMHTLYKEASHEQASPAKRRSAPEAVPRMTDPSTATDAFPLRSLQEAILTLEWEISRRSVTVLANELRKVRIKFKDNVTVDFAALSMRVVLDYVVKRMSRAHPESIRFLLDVTDYLGKSMESSSTDPLLAFHDILTRYEKYKSAVRKAEGIPDTEPPILKELSIQSPDAFAQMVRIQALTLKRAGESLADRMHGAKDPENLIRSFRFLVNRVVSRILESTREGTSAKPVPRKTRRKS